MKVNAWIRQEIQRWGGLALCMIPGAIAMILIVRAKNVPFSPDALTWYLVCFLFMMVGLVMFGRSDGRHGPYSPLLEWKRLLATVGGLALWIWCIHLAETYDLFQPGKGITEEAASSLQALFSGFVLLGGTTYSYIIPVWEKTPKQLRLKFH